MDFEPAVRRVAMSPFMSLSQNMLKLLGESNATGEGGVCFADSGSPKFLNVNGQDVAVAITDLADHQCEAMSSNWRLDTPSARGFLGQFVTLP